MSFNFAANKDALLFVPLGGANEIGMNLNCYHYQGKWLLVDFGIGFADDFLPGVDVVVPNIEFLLERKDDIVGLVLTHAHEDHLGAVPYLWRELGCPIYATRFTLAFLQHKLDEEQIPYRGKLFEVTPGGALDLAPFRVEMVGLTHSIPEMQALAIRTDKGVIMHTGDWKFDADPLVGPVSDEAALKRYGDEGVLALVCDSTNVFEKGHSGSEGEVRKHLIEAIRPCKQRVVVSTFASNVARLETIFAAAEELGRVVVLAGRSLWRIVDAGRQSGYFQQDIEFLSDKQAMDIPRQDVLIVATGSQGEPLAALPKMARGEHPSIRLSPGDAVVFASRKIPGNERRIAYMQNKFVERGIQLITDKEHFIHVSGHPARDELTRMYQLTRPAIAVPVHGEPRHLAEHARLAYSLGVKEAIIPTNGAVIELAPGGAEILARVTSGYIAVDGASLIPTDSPILRTRRRLRDDGCVMLSVAIDRDGRLAAAPALHAPGCLDAEEDKDLITEMVDAAADAVEALRSRAQDNAIIDAARTTLRSFIKRELGKKPMIEVQILRV